VRIQAPEKITKGIILMRVAVTKSVFIDSMMLKAIRASKKPANNPIP